MSQSRAWRSVVLMALGAGIGAIGIVYLIRIMQRREQEPVESALARPAASAIMLKPTSAPRAIQRTAVRLTVSAEPRRFTRNQSGAIRVKTLPGATCTITVTYSTGSAPASLRASTATADEQGVCGWSWQVGTGGTYADVEVQAEAEGYEKASAKKRVSIVD